MEEGGDKGREIIDEILLPHQKALLITMSALKECFNAGIPGAIAFGQTGQILDLTAAAKKGFENLCSESLSKIESQTRKWEKEIFEQVKQCLYEDSHRRLSHLFDFESDAGAVNIHLLLKGSYR